MPRSYWPSRFQYTTPPERRDSTLSATFPDHFPSACFVARYYGGVPTPVGTQVGASQLGSPRIDDPHSVPHAKLQHHHIAYAAEATGLLIVALVLLILVVVRYWSYIAWSAR
jgi:hypothetical protein